MTGAPGEILKNLFRVHIPQFWQLNGNSNNLIGGTIPILGCFSYLSIRIDSNQITVGIWNPTISNGIWDMIPFYMLQYTNDWALARAMVCKSIFYPRADAVFSFSLTFFFVHLLSTNLSLVPKFQLQTLWRHNSVL